MKKKIIAGASAAAVAAAVAVAAFLSGFTGGKNVAAAPMVRVTPLAKGNLEVSVSATGTVYSADSTNVYSTLNYPVKAIYVSAGDDVAAGDVLAELDTSDLEEDLVQRKASFSASQAKANQNLADAQRALDAYLRNAEEGYDSSLLNAQSSLASAELNLKSAELDLQSRNNDLRAARQALSDAREGVGDYEYADVTDSMLEDLRNKLYTAETNLEKAQNSLENAQANLEKAKISYEAAKVSSGDSLADYEARVKSAQLSADLSDQWLSIENLEKDLEKAVIKAPVSGTVTAVNAVEGGGGNGLLFIIQDTGRLKVITNIKEYDIADVAVGNRVTIKTDATGDTEFEGVLAKIAPTSTTTAAGGTNSSTDAEYESEVTVSSNKDGLRIGMNARMNIITEERKDVYSVPFEAVAQMGPESVVYVAARQEDGSFTAQPLTVTTGLENDLYIEIMSDELTDGMQVISDSEGITPGAVVEVRGAMGAEGEGAPPGDMAGGRQQQGGGVRIGMGGGPRGG